MTTNQPDRLDLVENDLENVKEILFTVARRYEASEKRMEASEKRMEATDERLMRLAETTDARINRLAEQQERISTDAEADRQVMFVMLEQMVTLQQENKQILEYLFGQQRNGNGGGPQQ